MCKTVSVLSVSRPAAVCSRSCVEMDLLQSNPIVSAVRRLSVSEPSPPLGRPSPAERQQTSLTDRLTVPIASAIRRLSISSQDGRQQDYDRQPNEYLEQIHQAQNSEQGRLEEGADAAGLMSGIKDRLSPSAIGSAIRRLSGYDADLQPNLPQNEYLQRLHEQAIAEQNRRERQEKALHIVHGIKDRLGTAIRRLSVYDESSSRRMTPQEYFTMFQNDDNDDSDHESQGPSAGLPEIVIDAESSGEIDGKRRSGWRKFNIFRAVVSSMTSNKPAKVQIPRAVCLPEMTRWSYATCCLSLLILPFIALSSPIVPSTPWCQN